MADYYSMFSVMIETKVKEEREWLIAQTKALTNAYEEANPDGLSEEIIAVLTEQGVTVEEVYPPECDLDERGLWLRNDESCGHEFAAYIAQAYLRKFKPDGCFGIEVSHSCSKPRLDAFGGSACFITADGVEWHGTGRWLDEKRAGHDERENK